MRPVLFDVAGASVPSYFALLVLGLCLLVVWFVRAGQRQRLPGHHMAFFAVAIYAAGLVGARLLYVIEHSRVYADPVAAALSLSPGGFALYGSAIGAAVAGTAYLRFFDLPGGQVADTLVAPLCGFGATARVGCLLAGCCYGKPTGASWGLVFPAQSEAAARFGYGTPLHPTQLYEAAALILLGGVLYVGRERLAFSGEKLLWLVLLFAGFRFISNFLRGDNLTWFGPLSFSQWTSGAIVIGMVAVLLTKRGRVGAGLQAPSPGREKGS